EHQRIERDGEGECRGAAADGLHRPIKRRVEGSGHALPAGVLDRPERELPDLPRCVLNPHVEETAGAVAIDLHLQAVGRAGDGDGAQEDDVVAIAGDVSGKVIGQLAGIGTGIDLLAALNEVAHVSSPRRQVPKLSKSVTMAAPATGAAGVAAACAAARVGSAVAGVVAAPGAPQGPVSVT